MQHLLIISFPLSFPTHCSLFSPFSFLRLPPFLPFLCSRFPFLSFLLLILLSSLFSSFSPPFSFPLLFLFFSLFLFAPFTFRPFFYRGGGGGGGTCAPQCPPPPPPESATEYSYTFPVCTRLLFNIQIVVGSALQGSVNIQIYWKHPPPPPRFFCRFLWVEKNLRRVAGSPSAYHYWWILVAVGFIRLFNLKILFLPGYTVQC